MTSALESGMFKDPAWHRCGVVVGREITDPQEAMVLSGTDWEVVKVQLADPTTGELEPSWAIRRKTDWKRLGIAGARLEPLQNRDAFEWFRPFLENGSAYIESAGSLHGGEVVFISAFLKDGNHDRQQAEIVPGDVVENRLLLTNNHNPARGGVPIAFVRERVVCANTLAVARGQYLKSGKYINVRRDGNLHERLAEVQESINLSKRSFEEEVDFYRLLAKREMSIQDCRNLLENLFSPELAKLAADDKPHTLEDYRPSRMILENLEQVPDLQLAGVAGTAWAAFNAATHYASHQARSTSPDTRLYSACYGEGQELIKGMRKQLEKTLRLS